MERSYISTQLRALRQRTNASVRDLAAALGYATGSGYQHLEDRFNRDFLPLDKTQALADFYAEHYQIDPGELLRLAGISGSAENNLEENQILVSGYVQAGSWESNNEIPWPDRHAVTVPEALNKEKGLAALEVRGDSMNLLLPEGSIVFVRDPVTHTRKNHPVVPDMLVVAQRRNADGDFETTIKQLEKKNGTFWLMPRSNNAIHQPLPYQPLDTWYHGETTDSAEADSLRIAGIVCGAIAIYI